VASRIGGSESKMGRERGREEKERKEMKK